MEVPFKELTQVKKENGKFVVVSSLKSVMHVQSCCFTHKINWFLDFIVIVFVVVA